MQRSLAGVLGVLGIASVATGIVNVGDAERCRQVFVGFGFPEVPVASGARYAGVAHQKAMEAWAARYEAWRQRQLADGGTVRRDDIELPPVPSDYQRFMHVAGGSSVEKTLQTGLVYVNYSSLYGTAYPMAAGGKAASDHLPGSSFLVVDLPPSHAKWHTERGSPGIVPTEYILGWFDHRNGFRWVPNPFYAPRDFPPPKRSNRRFGQIPSDGWEPSPVDADAAKAYFAVGKNTGGETYTDVQDNLTKVIAHPTRKTFKLSVGPAPLEGRDLERMATYRWVAELLGYKVGEYQHAGDGFVEAKLEPK